MPSIKEKLKSLAHYFLCNRNVGHTRALLEGANNVPDTIFLTADRRTQDDIGDSAPNALPLALHKLDHLRGMNKPLVIDNGALTYLFLAAAEEIERLEEELIDARMLLGKRINSSQKNT